jgi:hypothetical protein
MACLSLLHLPCVTAAAQPSTPSRQAPSLGTRLTASPVADAMAAASSPHVPHVNLHSNKRASTSPEQRLQACESAAERQPARWALAV